ncbi:hypothetical protein [Neobacillus drentensis]|uniref:hypothetical protein n=1 Tax=Neobacillus drentensis TaxID=220684 RepID=UPI002FFD941D
MDKAIMFGMYEFVNFHICKSLLNKGIEVKGIHLEDPENVPFLDEKRFEVGRNANFIEQTLPEWESNLEDEKNNIGIFISVYDLFMSKKDHIFQDEAVTKPIIQYLENNKNDVKIVLILPVQLLTSTFKGKEIENFVSLIKALGKSTQLFYLPAIYGPWQTPDFLFQQVFISNYQKVDIISEEREWTNDILFINDAIEPILELIETEKTGGFLLESGRKNHWLRCADYLEISENHMQNKSSEILQVNSAIVKIPVKKVTPFNKAIKEQRDHVQRLYANHL